MTTTTLDPKAAYAAAAKAHDDLIRQFREAAARAAHLRTAIANIRESGVGNVLGMESAEDCLTRAQPLLDAAEDEVRRLGAECNAANEVASRARAAWKGEPLPEPVVRVVAPAPAVAPKPERLSELEQALADGRVIRIEDHNAAVLREVDWQRRWFDKAQVAERQVAVLRDLIDRTAVDRLTSVMDVLDATPAQRTAKHGIGCWQRHTGCLAARIRDLLDGREVKA